MMRVNLLLQKRDRSDGGGRVGVGAGEEHAEQPARKIMGEKALVNERDIVSGSKDVPSSH